MPKPFSFANVELDVEPGSRTLPERLEPDTPFRILILGDFSGRENRGVFEPDLARRPVPIDRDNFDQVLEKLHPALEFPVSGSQQAASLLFRNLEDFHPDSIFGSAPLFRALRQTRQGLSDRATFAAAAAALRPPEPPAPPSPALAPGKISLDDLLDGPGGGAAPGTGAALEAWDALIRDVVAPHLVPGADPRQAELVARVDSVIAGQMRALLRQPAFQRLEAAWRALWRVVQRVETGADLKLCLLDISKPELAAQLDAAHEDLRASDAWRVIVGNAVRTPGAQPWTLLAGDYFFDQSAEDLRLLSRIGAIAGEGGAPFLAAASSGMLKDLATGPYRQLRTVPQASWIGLAMPRWLLRLPYGADTTPVEQFAFEEMPQHEHDGYLWGNAAFVCVCLLANAFSQAGWDMRPGSVRDFDDLPLHVYRENGDVKVKPCAEVLMTEETAEVLLDNGIMPLVSLKDRDCVRLLRFQSIADPPAALSGPWA